MLRLCIAVGGEGDVDISANRTVCRLRLLKIEVVDRCSGEDVVQLRHLVAEVVVGGDLAGICYCTVGDVLLHLADHCRSLLLQCDLAVKIRGVIAAEL